MFEDRRDAGRQLADRLATMGGPEVVVLGLPRGGVPVAAEVAKALHAPLDVIVVRKLGVPVQPELAMGAIGEDGIRVLDQSLVEQVGVSRAQVQRVEEAEQAELQRRATRFRQVRDRVPLEGRTALVIDDGIATGATARAACQVARAHGADRVILAVPVAPPAAAERVGDACDEFICLHSPPSFHAVGQWYRNFSQTTDEEVTQLLQQQAG